MSFPSIRLHGLRLHSMTEPECVSHILGKLGAGEGGWVVTANLDILRQCASKTDLMTLVERADLIVPDGMPLLWASWLQRTPMKARVTGSNLITSLSAAAADRNKSVYLLGGARHTALEASRALKSRYESLEIAGTHYPPPGFENDPDQMDELIASLCRTRPDIVFIGLGFPKQEHLIQRIRPFLPRSWLLGVGISFSFLSGQIPRAPQWVQMIGLEWLFRLVHEPRRLFSRYIVYGLPFALRLFLAAFFSRGETRQTEAAPLAADAARDDG